MKRSYIPFLMILSILISSCSNEDNITDNQQQGLLKSYKVSRDADGRYTIDYDLVEGAYTETVKDAATQSNNIYAFEGNRSAKNTNLKQLELEDNKLKIGVFENSVQKNSITVEDENIVLGKGEINPNFLQTYSVEFFGEGKYVLDFIVKEGVSPSFVYNDELNIYEVHLKEGTNTGSTSFTKVYTKSPNLPLKIDFVNYIKTNNRSRSDNISSSALAYETSRRPRIKNGGSDFY